jgi:exopolyphosphatase / guanosine-5'-triphosphate,3'-diphosphate pyrophosphatase
LEEDDKIIVSKLAAIIKLADALDISHKKQGESLDISLTGQDICFFINVRGDVLLETWDFNSHSTFFEEVYGLKPILKRKG